MDRFGNASDTLRNAYTNIKKSLALNEDPTLRNQELDLNTGKLLANKNAMLSSGRDTTNMGVGSSIRNRLNNIVNNKLASDTSDTLGTTMTNQRQDQANVGFTGAGQIGNIANTIGGLNVNYENDQEKNRQANDTLAINETIENLAREWGLEDIDKEQLRKIMLLKYQKQMEDNNSPSWSGRLGSALAGGISGVVGKVIGK